MGMKLYVDDLRRCPEGWKLARTITDAIGHLYNGRVDEISLDHDVVFLRGSDIRMHKESFMSVRLFMCVMPVDMRPAKVRIHTANVDAGYKDITLIPLGDDVLSEDITNLKRDL